MVVPLLGAGGHRHRGADLGTQDALGPLHGGPDRAGARRSLLGHSSITTTGDIYTDWDIDQLEQTMRDVVGEDEK